MDNTRNEFPSIDHGQQRNARPCDLMRVPRNPYDTQVRPRREILDWNNNIPHVSIVLGWSRGEGSTAKGGHTGEGGTDGAPAGIPEVGNDALLECRPDVPVCYVLTDLGVFPGDGRGDRKELDK